MGFETLLQVVQAETVLLGEMKKFLEKILSNLIARDKDAVQNGLSEYQTLTNSLAQAEAVRTRVYETICKTHGESPKNGMRSLLDRADIHRRPAFLSAFREFKIIIGEVRAVSRALRVYSEAQLLTIDSFMTEFLPEQQTGTYGHTGKQKIADRPVLVNSLG